jgi:hypothetical protein
MLYDGLGRVGREHIPKMWDQIQLPPRPRPPFWGNLALYTHLGFSLLINASGFKCKKKQQISSNTSEGEEEREREGGSERKGEREREREGGGRVRTVGRLRELGV